MCDGRLQRVGDTHRHLGDSLCLWPRYLDRHILFGTPHSSRKRGLSCELYSGQHKSVHFAVDHVGKGLMLLVLTHIYLRQPDRRKTNDLRGSERSVAWWEYVDLPTTNLRTVSFSVLSDWRHPSGGHLVDTRHPSKTQEEQAAKVLRGGNSGMASNQVVDPGKKTEQC